MVLPTSPTYGSAPHFEYPKQGTTHHHAPHRTTGGGGVGPQRTASAKCHADDGLGRDGMGRTHPLRARRGWGGREAEEGSAA